MDSLYDKSKTRLDKLKNVGYAYEGKIFEKTMSPFLFLDPTRSDILKKYEELVFFLIEKTKSIKTFYNYTVDKNYRHIN